MTLMNLKVEPLTLRDFESARRNAEILNGSDEEWTYRLEPRGKWYAIQVIDEDGVLIGYL